MNNTTAANTTAANTTNQTGGYWQPIDLDKIPDFNKVIIDVETGVVNMLTGWNLDPFHTIFCLFVVAVLILIISQMFVHVTSKSSGIFKPILYIVVVIVLLLLLGVI